MNETRFAAFREVCQHLAPELFLVLGSGLATIVERVSVQGTIAFAEIPGMPATAVAGHRGRMSVGHWASRPVLVAEGRLHYYEGHPWEVVVQPIELAAALGVRKAILTNAAGGIREDLEPGSLMPVRDHLEWNRPFPWREPVQATPYAPDLLDRIVHAGRGIGLDLRPGIYAAVTGPSYETPAEIRALRDAGADAVGMSTSREVLAGNRRGLACAAVSLITNRAAGLASHPLAHAEVLAMGKKGGAVLGQLLEALLRDGSAQVKKAP